MTHRYLVTGTDTDVGKTRITAALALALRAAAMSPVIVKLVQTGVRDNEAGDAQHAGELAGCAYMEVARFFKAADPWSAALADGLPPVRGADIKLVVDSIAGPIVAEGAGGIAVPLNREQTFLDVAQLCELTAVVVIGLRLGCINHALLTAASLRERGVPVAGAVLCERWEATSAAYREDVTRGLQGKLDVLGILPFDADERRSVERGAQIFKGMIG
ncbi:MAG: dethiobiotin synthase [Candidatus Eremiobacteraeota bacterium]|nr:dethiobiotin synthase [Candidatus Eremiobacteraeota bacterium]